MRFRYWNIDFLIIRGLHSIYFINGGIINYLQLHMNIYFLKNSSDKTLSYLDQVFWSIDISFIRELPEKMTRKSGECPFPSVEKYAIIDNLALMMLMLRSGLLNRDMASPNFCPRPRSAFARPRSKPRAVKFWGRGRKCFPVLVFYIVLFTTNSLCIWRLVSNFALETPSVKMIISIDYKRWDFESKKFSSEVEVEASQNHVRPRPKPRPDACF